MSVREESLPQRLARAVGKSPVSEKVAATQEVVYKRVLDWVGDSPFHTPVLGYSIHPPLTDLTLGCWVSASILDLVGGAQARRSAAFLLAVGVAASVPTSFAGASDWVGMTGSERRIGAVHALGTDAATFINVASLIARRRGHHTLGVALGLTGTAVIVGSGLLGGQLALNRGTARRAPTAA